MLRSTLVDALGVVEREALERRLRPRRYRRGQTVVHDGDAADCLQLVQRGRVQVELSTADGHRFTVRVVQPGQCFGELALVHPEHRQVGRVCALEAVEALVLHRADFETLRDEHRGIDRMVVTALAEGLARASTLAVELLLPADVRVWRRLAELADGYGGDPIRMSQDQLAHVAGTGRQTANRVLQAGVQLGVLTVRRGAVLVTDRAALERLGQRG